MNSETQLPGKSGLRTFGLLFSAILVVLFGLVIPFIRFGIPAGLPAFASGSGPAWPWWAAGVIIALALAFPQSLIWLYRPWMKFAHVAQWVNTRIIMFLLFYFIIFPIGLVRRLLRLDSMQRKYDRNASSYRVRLGEADHNDMTKPY